MSFHGLSLPSRALLPWDKSRQQVGSRASSTASLERDANHRRLDSSSEVSAYIDLYTLRDPALEVALGENARPAPASFMYKRHPEIPELQGDIPAPRTSQDASVLLRRDSMRLPLPAFDQYGRLPTEAQDQGKPAPQVGHDSSTTTPAPSSPSYPSSSDYPSEGIRSEDCLSPPGDPFGSSLLDATAGGVEAAVIGGNDNNAHNNNKDAVDVHRSRNLNLSDLSQYCWPSRRDGTRPFCRSSSLTDASGPHERNVSTSLLDELAAAEGYAGGADANAGAGVDVDVDGRGSDSGGVTPVEGKNVCVEVIYTDKHHSNGEEEGLNGEEGSDPVAPETLNEAPARGDEGWWSLSRSGGSKTVGEMLGIGRRGSATGKAGGRNKKQRKFRLGKWVRKAIKRTKSEFFRKGVQELFMRDKVKQGGKKRAQSV